MKWFDVLWYSFMYVFVLILAIFFLRTEYGFSERREPKWFYLFIYSVYTSVVFFLFYIYTYFFFYFHSIVNVFASLLLSYWRNKIEKNRNVCANDDHSAYVILIVAISVY